MRNGKQGTFGDKPSLMFSILPAAAGDQVDIDPVGGAITVA